MDSGGFTWGVTRRDFLKLLGAIGVAIALPVPLDKATEEQLAAVCEKLAEEPFFFDVDPYDTISIRGVEDNPILRREVYKIEFKAEGIVDQIESAGSLSCDLEEIYGEDWREEHPRELLRHAEEWLAGDLDEWDLENLPPHYGPVGEAREFFLCGCSDSELDALGVVLVDGDHPGSSYHAAELLKSIAEANAAAKRLGLPYRFRPEGAA